jgi:hypothetical protein
MAALAERQRQESVEAAQWALQWPAWWVGRVAFRQMPPTAPAQRTQCWYRGHPGVGPPRPGSQEAPVPAAPPTLSAWALQWGRSFRAPAVAAPYWLPPRP